MSTPLEGRGALAGFPHGAWGYFRFRGDCIYSVQRQKNFTKLVKPKQDPTNSMGSEGLRPRTTGESATHFPLLTTYHRGRATPPWGLRPDLTAPEHATILGATPEPGARGYAPQTANAATGGNNAQHTADTNTTFCSGLRQGTMGRRSAAPRRKVLRTFLLQPAKRKCTQGSAPKGVRAPEGVAFGATTMGATLFSRDVGKTSRLPLKQPYQQPYHKRDPEA